jgi:hypothetical protein
MSVLARRAREQDDARRRALLQMGDSVIAAVTEQMPHAGSLAVEEAVETALAEILEDGAHRCDLELATRWWIRWAKLRMIDGGRLSASRDRDPIPVDEHPAALAHSILEDPLALAGDGLDAAGLQEILSSLSGRQREWADGLFGLLRQAAIDGAPAAKLHEVLGWSPEKTRKTGQRARQTIKVFIEDRASGVICSRRQAVLDAFIMATKPSYRAAALDDVGVDVDCRQFQAVVVHLAGCPECQAVWSRRRATLLARCASVALVPVDALAAAAQAFAGKLAGALSGAQNAALSILARVSVGGGAAAAGGSALTGKTAAVCVGIVCAASAGTAELTGVLPPIAPERTPVTRQQAKRPAAPAKRAPARSSVRAAATAAVALAPPPPAAVRRTTRTATSSPAPPAVSTPQFTPGDLDSTSSTSRAAATAPPPPPPPLPPPPPAPPVASTSSSCTPGDLGC